MGTESGKEVITLAGGCFWCLQPIFQDLKGVDRVEVGYAGGQTKNPTYEDVCTDSTGHAEVVQVTFDPRALPLDDLLKIFFTVHDPTTLNRQGHDSGTQYRSAVFYATREQKATTERGEEYHQDYFAKNPWQGYCRAVVAPKVAKFRKQFAARLKSQAPGRSRN